VTKHTAEPYRMMTSRAEYRLLLRQDNADIRLTKIGYEVGLISKERYESLLQKEAQIEEEIKRLKSKTIGGKKEVNDFLVGNGSTPLLGAVTLADLIKRPELNYEALAVIDDERPKLSEAVGEQVNINIKYEGYIERENRQVEQFKKMENRLIPEGIDYENIDNIRKEARQKLSEIRPLSVGQASRISGVSPSDIAVLLVYIEQFKRRKKWD
jgi:tRNA uridine 5-carboxymethylaminomethyl modification enzyme mnmG